jgi:hypothetical protein
MNWNIRYLPSNTFNREQRAEREQRAYQRRLLRLRARDRRWGGPSFQQNREKRSRACQRAEIRAAQAVPLLSPGNKLCPWQRDWDLLDERGVAR